MTLDVEAVLQAQRTEFVLAELAGKETAQLVAILGDAGLHQGLVPGIVAVHASFLYAMAAV